MPSKYAAGCDLVRVPGFQDLHSDYGLKYAKSYIKAGHVGHFIHMKQR